MSSAARECTQREDRPATRPLSSPTATLDLFDSGDDPWAAGVQIRELGAADAAQVAAVESANHADYPQTPATRHEPVTAQSFMAMLDHGSRAWAAVRDGELIGVAVATAKAAQWRDITFASVLAGHRRTGIGQALAAAIIDDLTTHGATRISTGGAASNHASRATALALGARLEPEWRTYAPP